MLIKICFAIFVSYSAFAQEAVKVTPEKALEAEYYNKHVAPNVSIPFQNEPKVIRPFAEYEKAKHFIFSGEFSNGTSELKSTILRNLPEDLSIFITAAGNSENVRAWVESLGQAKRTHILDFPSGTSLFWARDGMPVPVYTEEGVGLVDAKYYFNFTYDAVVAKHYGYPLLAHNYMFEGGNFLADTKGRCFIINNHRHIRIPDNIFETKYGCKSVTRFPHIKGIGHIDESIKFVSDTIALTDTPSYVPTLESLGFTVKLLPRPVGQYETYVNALLVNNTIFVPVFSDPEDEIALKIYRDLGFKIVPLESSSLSEGLGSVHCITMTYP